MVLRSIHAWPVKTAAGYVRVSPAASVSVYAGAPPGPAVASNGAVVVSYPPQRIVKAVTFDPRQVATVFTICAPEYFELLVLPHLMRGFREAGLAVLLAPDVPAVLLEMGR